MFGGQFKRHKLWPIYDRHLKSMTEFMREAGLPAGKNYKNYIRGFVFSAVSLTYLKWSGGGSSEIKQAEINQWLELLMKERGFWGWIKLINVLHLTNCVVVPQKCLGEDWQAVEAHLSQGKKYEDLEAENIWEYSWSNFKVNMFTYQAEADHLYSRFKKTMGDLWRQDWTAEFQDLRRPPADD